MKKLLLIGRKGGTHVGESLLRACQDLKESVNCKFVDVQTAYTSSPLWSKISYHLLGKKPANIDFFSQEVLRICDDFQPDYLFTNGIAPLTKQTLERLSQKGIKTLNFLTDDPWNSKHYAPWFMEGLTEYGVVFSPRQVNLEQLRQFGCQAVHYLPFGYDPYLFYPVSPKPEELATYSSDVMFAGGGDKDRLPYISALIKAGINVGLYGGYWERYPETKSVTRGLADIGALRLAIQSSKIALCLVRQANRDGHVMRTFEVPAVGACMLTEDTPEHREIFGEEGKCVVYFKSISEMIEKTRWLLDHPDERKCLSLSAHQHIIRGSNTYSDRLHYILNTLSQ
jgi:spore maturation protein CgeB